MARPQLGSLTNFNSVANSVASETINKDMNLFHFGIPLTSISENISLRTPFSILELSGVFEGTEAEMLAFINEIDTASSTNQTEKTYTSGLGKTFDVKINNFTYTSEPNTNLIGYTLQLYDETL